MPIMPYVISLPPPALCALAHARAPLTIRHYTRVIATPCHYARLCRWHCHYAVAAALFCHEQYTLRRRHAAAFRRYWLIIHFIPFSPLYHCRWRAAMLAIATFYDYMPRAIITRHAILLRATYAADNACISLSHYGHLADIITWLLSLIRFYYTICLRHIIDITTRIDYIATLLLLPPLLTPLLPCHITILPLLIIYAHCMADITLPLRAAPLLITR